MVFDYKVNTCVYADNVTIFSSTAPGLQALIDKCADYAKRWHLIFKKAQLSIVGKEHLKIHPEFYLNSHEINIYSNMEILGVNFDSLGKFTTHVHNCISACRRSMYKLASIGFQYPGFHSNLKTYVEECLCPNNVVWNGLYSPLLI